MKTDEPRKEARLEIRVTPAELAILDRYCEAVKRTRADVLRETIRALARKKP